MARKPQILVVDEMAHSNAEGSRHPKRHQDIDELLAAGIDVWTALNIQHLESLSDLVTRIAGVEVREIVPDVALKTADEVILVDLPPAELIERLKEGKVYLPEMAHRAIEGFFRPATLTALRELALRRDRRPGRRPDGRFPAPERHRRSLGDGGAAAGAASAPIALSRTRGAHRQPAGLRPQRALAGRFAQPGPTPLMAPTRNAAWTRRCGWPNGSAPSTRRVTAEDFVDRDPAHRPAREHHADRHRPAATVADCALDPAGPAGPPSAPGG